MSAHYVKPYLIDYKLMAARKLDKEYNIFQKIGVVNSVADGIVNFIGMYKVSNGEVVDIMTAKGPVTCLVLNIEIDKIGAIILDSDINVKPGQFVVSRNSLLKVPCGAVLLGRIVNPLGQPLDGKGSVPARFFRMVETIAPSIICRSPVRSPMETGLKVVDSIIPIGHGQRELIIGDSKTGKTSIAIDAIINQKYNDNICVYVAIGQKRSSVARIAKILERNGCLSKTIIVAATASDSAAMQFVAPYCGVSMAEFYMNSGLRALVVYDDLTKHAVSYRQLSLLLRRPPAREGYPGDIFYVHSRLLERAANLLNSGSITALPIVETTQGDVSAYIPTNVISITDGQIFLDRELFSNGVRPAVSPGLSVSRVGSAAQNNVLKKMSGSMKLELAQFREVEGFIKLGCDLDDVTAQLIDRGLKLTCLLIQKHSGPVTMDKQILFLYSAIYGYLDWMLLEVVPRYERELFGYYVKSAYHYPLEGVLTPKDNEMPEDIVAHLIYNFTAGFHSFLEKITKK